MPHGWLLEAKSAGVFRSKAGLLNRSMLAVAVLIVPKWEPSVSGMNGMSLPSESLFNHVRPLQDWEDLSRGGGGVQLKIQGRWSDKLPKTKD
jgi:hypothetical protein